MANPKFPKMPDDMTVDVCRRYLAGESAKSIAKTIPYTDVTVVRVLRRNGIEIRPHGDTKSASKFCPDCKKGVPISEFYGVERGHVDNRCKTCRKAYAAKWKKDNREKSLGLARDYARRNKDRQLANSRKRNAENPAKFQASKAKKKARDLGIEGTFTWQEFVALCDKFGNVCLSCGVSAKLTVDHVIPLSQNGCTNDIGNIQPLCLSCNSSKGTKTIDYRPNED